METTFTDKDTYQNIFDPEEYLNTYYNPKSGIFVVDGILDFELKKLHEAFNTRCIRGKTLIDIGHGPTIYQDLSACESFDEIFGADYSDRNREYYERSLRNEAGTFDWTDVIQKVCVMEGKGAYLFGGKRFSCLLLTEDFTRSAIIEAGYEIVDLEVIPRKYNEDQCELCNHDSVIFVLARKVNDPYWESGTEKKSYL